MTEGHTQAEVLLGFASDLELFRTPDEDAYASITLDHGFSTHRETWPVRGKMLRSWLAKEFFRTEAKPPSSEAMKGAIDILEAKALFEGDTRPVYTRVAVTTGAVYLDLGDDEWRVVEVDGAGWRFVHHSPVHFRRPKTMLPLPAPTQGNVEDLRALLNIESDDDWRLIVAWEVCALGGRGPYPILVPTGEQGAAKSTQCRILRGQVDPSSAPLRSPPRNEDALMIAAKNGRVVAIDNVSELSEWQADALCRLATGGGVSKRQLYTDDGEIIFDSMRPILMNGITDIVTRGDLADRSIVITLPTIPDEKRLHERRIFEEFDSLRPGVLGALLTGVSRALRDADSMVFQSLPRMADFAAEASAAAPSFGWTKDEFLSAYRLNRGVAVEVVLESDVVAQAILSFVEKVPLWEGTASALLAELEKLVSERVLKSKDWPGARGLSGRLRRLAPDLRRNGINTTFSRTGERRLIGIEKASSLPSFASQPSQTNGDNGLAGDGVHDANDAGDDGDDVHDDGRAQPSPHNSQNPTTHDGHDANDGSSHDESRWESLV